MTDATMNYNTDTQREYLLSLYNNYVKHPDGHWKGRAECVVPREIADDVAAAMNFFGSIVDFRQDTFDGQSTVLVSKGYWAHGF